MATQHHHDLGCPQLNDCHRPSYQGLVRPYARVSIYLLGWHFGLRLTRRMI